LIASCPGDEIDDETTSNKFISIIKKHLKYLAHIKHAATKMQKGFATLSDCQHPCNILESLVKDGYGKVGDDLQHCW
jgi:hypothetical protein